MSAGCRAVSLLLHLAALLPFPPWACDFLLSQPPNTFHIRGTLSRLGLLSSQIGCSCYSSHTFERPEETLTRPVPSSWMFFVVCGLSFMASTFISFASQILLITSVRNQYGVLWLTCHSNSSPFCFSLLFSPFFKHTLQAKKNNSLNSNFYFCNVLHLRQINVIQLLLYHQVI